MPLPVRLPRKNAPTPTPSALTTHASKDNHGCLAKNRTYHGILCIIKLALSVVDDVEGGSTARLLVSGGWFCSLNFSLVTGIHGWRFWSVVVASSFALTVSLSVVVAKGVSKISCIFLAVGLLLSSPSC